VFLPVPAANCDFASFSFQVPIWGSAAKHTAAAKKQNISVNPNIFVFMRRVKT
jgi:hypothetical protein